MKQEIGMGLKSLVIFRHILQDEVMQKLLILTETDINHKGEAVNAYCEFTASLFAHSCDWTGYLLKLVREDENIYTKYYITGKGDGETLEPLLSRELKLLSEAGAYNGEDFRNAIPELQGIQWKTSADDFEAIYREEMKHVGETGFGIFARYHMFMLDDDGQLLPVKHYDTQTLDQLYGYEKEREKVLANTRALLEGKPANHVLLYGDAGTGKSSTVKAIANAYYDRGLRLVELKKNQLYLIPGLVDQLAVNPLKFILFIDDLMFSSEDRDFCALKAILEGSVSGRSSNIAIYATSNHRHLVREFAADRVGDEICVADKLQETASLAARFGLVVTFLSPDKLLYEDIVRGLAKERGLDVPDEELITRAEAQALRNGGRTARTARQVVDMMLAGVQ